MIRLCILALVFLAFSTPVKAEEKLNIFGWSMLPVLHEGRVQPIDSFARIYLKRFSGNDTGAAEWLAESVFAPDISATKPLFQTTRQKENYSYLELKNLLRDQDKNIQALLEKPKNEWSINQKEIMRLYHNFILYSQILGSIIETEGQSNVLLRVIRHEDIFVSPWSLIHENKATDASKEYLSHWHRMAIAYANKDAGAWRDAVQNTLDDVPNTKLALEVLYNVIGFTGLALAFYALSLFFMILVKLLNKPDMAVFSARVLIFGCLLHAMDIALRVYILERPPVGTLYESILFVSLICVFGFLFMARKQKSTTPVLLGSLSGVLLLVTAQSFVDIDTMGTLVAVLNTNFWLATHVICITIGYGCCLMTSLLAHYDLYKPQQAVQKNIKTLAILSLLFVTTGTVLGGLWADQSWGRFWGWDPKENGALLIILWLVWLLHGRVSHHIDEQKFSIGMALLSIIVVLAWFGVNLLSVGLHSYGFIDGIAWGIALFCLFELSLVGFLWWQKKKELLQ